MGAFFCPTCKTLRHVEDGYGDPSKDHCWKCGTLVPYTEEELKRMAEDMAEDLHPWSDL